MKQFTTLSLPLLYVAACMSVPSCGKPPEPSGPQREAQPAKDRNGVRPPDPVHHVNAMAAANGADPQKGTLASAIHKIVQNTPETEISSELKRLIGNLETISDEQFREIVGSLPPGETSLGAFNTLITKLSMSDPRGLGDLLISMKSSLSREWYADGMWQSAAWNARMHGIDALRWIDSADIPEQTKVNCFAVAIEYLNRTDATSVVSAVDALSDDQIKHSLMSKRPYTDALQKANLPADDVTTRINSLPTAELREQTARSIGQSYGEKSDPAGLEAISGIGDENILRDGFITWFGASMKNDAHASLEALNAVPPWLKNHLVQRLVQNVGSWDRASAEAWINSISDPELRERTATAFFRK